ncbi:hypothetical protein HDU76_012820 [Blyttiomyces sp. JEL0837]|nr:hypothetical protein HDU76_012820 [Blyttiomyces sp. JEL0837]
MSDEAQAPNAVMEEGTGEELVQLRNDDLVVIADNAPDISAPTGEQIKPIDGGLENDTVKIATDDEVIAAAEVLVVADTEILAQSSLEGAVEVVLDGNNVVVNPEISADAAVSLDPNFTPSHDQTESDNTVHGALQNEFYVAATDGVDTRSVPVDERAKEPEHSNSRKVSFVMPRPGEEIDPNVAAPMTQTPALPIVILDPKTDQRRKKKSNLPETVPVPRTNLLIDPKKGVAATFMPAPFSSAMMSTSTTGSLMDPETGHHHPTYLHASGMHGHGHSHTPRSPPTTSPSTPAATNSTPTPTPTPTSPSPSSHGSTYTSTSAATVSRRGHHAAKGSGHSDMLEGFQMVATNPSIRVKPSSADVVDGDASAIIPAAPPAQQRASSAPVMRSSISDMGASPTPHGQKRGSKLTSRSAAGTPIPPAELLRLTESKRKSTPFTHNPFALSPVAPTVIKTQTVRGNIDRFRIEQVALRRLRFVVEHNETEVEHLSIVDLVETGEVPSHLIQKYFGSQYMTAHDLRVLVLQSIDKTKRVRNRIAKAAALAEAQYSYRETSTSFYSESRFAGGQHEDRFSITAAQPNEQHDSNQSHEPQSEQQRPKSRAGTASTRSPSPTNKHSATPTPRNPPPPPSPHTSAHYPEYTMSSYNNTTSCASSPCVLQQRPLTPTTRAIARDASEEAVKLVYGTSKQTSTRASTRLTGGAASTILKRVTTPREVLEMLMQAEGSRTVLAGIPELGKSRSTEWKRYANANRQARSTSSLSGDSSSSVGGRTSVGGGRNLSDGASGGGIATRLSVSGRAVRDMVKKNVLGAEPEDGEPEVTPPSPPPQPPKLPTHQIKMAFSEKQILKLIEERRLRHLGL